MWHRVFSLTAAEVSPSALAAHLHAAGVPIEPHFKGDDLGWTSGELRFADGGPPIVLDRYMTAEDGLRPELNAFAAELEAADAGPVTATLMRHVIQTQQMVTLHQDGSANDAVLVEACRFVAGRTDGIYQIDGTGWFAADGSPLLEQS